MSEQNRALIDTFYEAFARRDADAMNACYHPEVEFSDPAFGELQGDEARAMWTMLCKRGKDLKIEHRDVAADATTGSAHWEARYTFAASGKPVHNVVEARFTFEDGLIRTHTDVFDFSRWASQALGIPGKLLGRTAFFQSAFQRKARALLAKQS